VLIGYAISLHNPRCEEGNARLKKFRDGRPVRGLAELITSINERGIPMMRINLITLLTILLAVTVNTGTPAGIAFAQSKAGPSN
jgi:hypothetical protein